MLQDKKLLKNVIWEGDSREVISSFPAHIKEDLGMALYQLQLGNDPKNSRPMKSIGSGVYELKDQDEKNWYRVIYFTKIKDAIYALHSFTKNSRKTSKKDLNIASQRLKNLKKRLKDEKKNSKKE